MISCAEVLHCENPLKVESDWIKDYELENGNYEKASKLSIGTIDQMYLSLRLSMVEELSDEKMPIILDEVFAYYDSNRLKNALKFIIEKFKGHQIIILTCTDREKDILKDIDINFNVVEL